ncbi:MAG: ABC transporter ATP-binding protein [Chloroflexi bacterium]|nr:ABC transporter ATP-binding protein [Chloroflexota bacterium]
MSTVPSVITVSHLSKKFGDFTAVDNISFDVRQGEIFGFLGPNGSGKTTTIRMLLGLLQPSAGAATVLGIDILKHPQDIARRVGYMSQRFSLYPDLTVDENLTFYGRTYGLHGRELQQRKEQTLDLIDLGARRQQLTANLAGGWKQRLALGAAILHRPELLFLDEPTAGVDPVSRRQFWQLLYTLASEHTTIFVTTHYMDEAEQCHRLAFIHNGKIIADGAPADIKRDRMPGQVVEIIADSPQRTLTALRAAGFAEVTLYGQRVHAADAHLDQRLDEIRQILLDAGAGPRDIHLIPPSLEDVFIANVRSLSPNTAN